MTINKNLAVATVISDLIGDICRDMCVECNIPRDVFRKYMDEAVEVHPEKFMMPVVDQIGKIMEEMDEEEAAEYYIQYLTRLARKMII